jgi:hypothetical protein
MTYYKNIKIEKELEELREQRKDLIKKIKNLDYELLHKENSYNREKVNHYMNNNICCCCYCAKEDISQKYCQECLNNDSCLNGNASEV